MRRHLGSASLAGGLVSWAAFLFGLVLGGLDPSPGRAPILQVAMMAASGVSVLALPRPSRSSEVRGGFGPRSG